MPQTSTNLVERLTRLRTTLSRHPEHTALLEGEVHLTLVAETLAAHTAALTAGISSEQSTNDQSATARTGVTASWNQLQTLVRRATNLLEWHVESNFPALLPEFHGLPHSRQSDARAVALLDFGAAHPELRAHQDTDLLLTSLAAALTQFHFARASLPPAKTAENTADTELQKAVKVADRYADCVESVLHRLLEGDRAALQEYGLVRQPRATPEALPPPAPISAS